MSAKVPKLSAAERRRIDRLIINGKDTAVAVIETIYQNAARRNGHSKPPSAPSRPATTARISARR